MSERWEDQEKANDDVEVLRQEFDKRLYSYRDGIDKGLLQIMKRSPIGNTMPQSPIVQPMGTAPKDGTTILVYFARIGWLTVSWIDELWCVDDFKHGPYPVRGRSEGDLWGWLDLNVLPVPEAAKP